MMQLLKPSRGHVTQFYGNTQPDGDPHAGQDYAYTSGREIFPEVYAAADGVVQFAGDSRNLGWPNAWYVNPDFNRSDNWDSSAGNLITLRHKQFSADTGYGHLEKCFVKAGDTVKAGQVIGIAGETGNSRGKHLHFFLMFHPFNYNTRTYGCSDPNPYFMSGIQFQGATTITPLEEDDMAYSEKQLTDIVYAAVEKVLMESRKFDGDRNALDAFKQSRLERAEILSTVQAVPGNVLYNERVDGRNLFDWAKHSVAVASSIKPGTVNIDELAGALAEQLEARDLEALAKKLQITVKES